MTNAQTAKHILITGASSGIGEALALHYARSGVVLSLSGRDEARLSKVAALCNEAGAAADIKILDVRDEEAVRAWVIARDTAKPLDLVIANAGVSGGTAEGAESAAQVHQIFDVNVNGVLNTIQPALEIMQKRQAGQVAIMSSLAGYFGWGSAPAYCASKAAVRVYGEALYEFFSKDNVAVSVICPGFVRTPMTNVNDFPMPFLIDTEQAAQKIAAGLVKKKKIIGFPLPMAIACKSLQFMPKWLMRLINAKNSGKSPFDNEM